MHLGLPWFGPKRGFGWGWTPVAWQGWLATAVFLAFILFLTYGPAFRHKGVLFVALLGGFLAFVIATGTKPGGRWY